MKRPWNKLRTCVVCGERHSKLLMVQITYGAWRCKRNQPRGCS